MDNFSLLEHSIVEPEFCVGCGTCVAMCNHGSIAMRFDHSGKYEAYYCNENSCISCGLCVKVCPFNSSNSNEDVIAEAKYKEFGVKHNEEVGYYLKSYVGYADQATRLNGASGGSLSQILKWLLQNNIVDKVITVEATNNPDKLFQYTIIDSSEDIDRCARSAYYPVEISEVLDLVRQASGLRFAIVGLPCVIKAIELAKQAYPDLRKKISFVFGLVCGQAKSKKYTEYLINNVGADRESIQNINFRHKVPGCKSSNFAFSVETTGGVMMKMWKDGVGLVWTNDFAKLNSCYYCDDVFAECADAVFMDAWLPEYTSEYTGTSLIVVRNPTLCSFFNQIDYVDIGIDKVIESQQGVLRNKRAFRSLYDSLALPNIAPQKRVFSTTFEITAVETNDCMERFVWAQQSRIGDNKVQMRIVQKMKNSSRRKRFKRIADKLLRTLKVR